MFFQGMFSTGPDEQHSFGTDNDASCDQEDSYDDAAPTTSVPLGLGFFSRMNEMKGREEEDNPPPLGMGFFSRIERLEGDRAQRAAAKAQVAAVPSSLPGPTAAPPQGEPSKASDDEQTPIAPVSNQTLLGEGAPMPQFTSRDEAQELATLTAEEIAASEADVRGLTADLASASIRDKDISAWDELDAELHCLPYEEKAAYIEALRRCPDQVDGKHKKAFLWREENDAKLAAKRIARYWERRKTLFGEKCFLPLTLTGALRGDELALQTCTIRPLPVKDTRGRAIFFWDTSLFDPSRCSAESMLRACWYIFNVHAHDSEVRDRGFVLLLIPRSRQASVNRNTLYARFELGKMIMSLEIDFLPILFRGIHYCQPGMFFHLTNPVIKYFMGKRLRERFKVHYGSDEEMLKRLEAYGIPPDRLPSELGGQVVLQHDQWLATRLNEECEDKDTRQSFAKIIYEPEALVSKIGKQGIVQASFDLTKHEDSLSSIELEAESARRRRQRRQDQEIPTRSRNEYCTATTPNVIPFENSSRNEGCTATMPNVIPFEDCGSGEELAHKSSSMKSHGTHSLSDSLSDDPRMNTALSAKVMDPTISSLQALVVGGYEFPSWEPGMTDRMLFDVDNVSLYERKQELQRRLILWLQDDDHKFAGGEESDASTSRSERSEITSIISKKENELAHSWMVQNSSLLDPTPIRGNPGVFTKSMNEPNIRVDTSHDLEGRLPMAAKKDYSAIVSVEDTQSEISWGSLNDERVREDNVLKAPGSQLQHLNCYQPPTNERIQAKHGRHSQDERLNMEPLPLSAIKDASSAATGNSAHRVSKGIPRSDSFDSFDERLGEMIDEEGSKKSEEEIFQEFNIDPIPLNEIK